MGGYTKPPTRTTYNGINYASYMESRFAKLLTVNNIEFMYSLWMEVEMDGAKVFREIDFLLIKRPIKPYWCSNFTSAFECKGVLQPSDYKRMRALRDQGIETFIITEPILKYWEEYGFLQHKMGAIKKKKTKHDNNVDF
jgi:hypothetical protein